MEYGKNGLNINTLWTNTKHYWFLVQNNTNITLINNDLT